MRRFLPALLAILVTACSELPDGPAETPSLRIRALTLADWTSNGYGSATGLAQVDAIAATGATHIVLVVTAYQTEHRADRVAVDPVRTPSTPAIQAAAARASALGMGVGIKPHIDLEDGSWRGTISPEDPAAWFESYREFVLPLVELASTLEADLFVAGTELAGTLVHENRWRSLIEDMRARYRGDLTYAASWDEAGLVPFFDALDYAGVDFYGPVTYRDAASRFEILKGWQLWLQRLEQLHGQSGRPVLITEIGYRSIDGAGRRPYEFGTERRLDPEEQSDLYWAALTALGEQRWVAGVVWWNWLASGQGGPDNDDYTPSGKPAEKELTDAWSR
jgi:hypothetical protein